MHRISLLSTSLLSVFLMFGCNHSVEEPVAEVIQCRSILGDRTAKKLDAWKFNLICDAAKKIPVDESGLSIGAFKELLQQSPENLQGNIPEFDEAVLLVLLEMEVRGEFTRIEQSESTSDSTVLIRNVAVGLLPTQL